jgi:4-amino-4-deoxy-L-arabinose transferase-like glycosyltransferase
VSVETSPVELARGRPVATASGLAAPYVLPLIALGAALLALLVRLPFLDWPLTVDEAGYAYGARLWSEGVSLYSDEVWFDRPQGIFVAYRAGMAVLGDSTEAIRLLGALWSAATVALVVWLADRMFDRRVALVAGAILAVVSAAPAIEGFVANAEVFMLLPATASAGCVWRRRPFAAGLLAGAAIILKPSGAAALLLAAWWLYRDREPLRVWLRLSLGAALLPTLALVHGVATAGVHDYLYATLLFRLLEGGSNPLVLSFVVGILATLWVWAPLAAAAALGWRRLSGRRRARSFLLAWLATSIVGMAMGGNWWAHYFVQLMPPLVLLVAAEVAATRPAARADPRALAVGLAAAAVLFAGLIWPAVSVPREDAITRYLHNELYLLSDDVAAYLRAEAAPDDQVFVALSHASVVYLSERRSSWPYLYSQQTTSIPGAFEDATQHLEDGVPAFVVTRPRQLGLLDPDGLLAAALEGRYERVRRFGEIDAKRTFEVWRRR